MTGSALKVSRSLYYFTTSVSHGVENYFPRLWGMGISAVFIFSLNINNILTTTCHCDSISTCILGVTS